MRLRPEPELGADVLAERRDALRVARGVPVLRLQRHDQRLDGLLLRGAQLEVAGEGAARDQDRHDEQRHDHGAELQVHPPEPQPKKRKRERSGR